MTSRALVRPPPTSPDLFVLLARQIATDTPSRLHGRAIPPFGPRRCRSASPLLTYINPPADDSQCLTP